MVGLIYLLCASTALISAVLLWRGYKANRVRLLFWSGACFLGLAIDNLVVFVDWATPPEIDLWAYRQIAGLIALVMLIYGLICESN